LRLQSRRFERGAEAVIYPRREAHIKAVEPAIQAQHQ
jgi:hypothetical protein